jgi:hypothetical protein
MTPEEEKRIIDRSRVDDGIFDMQNVQSFYPGTKIKNGVDTGEPCLVVGVTKKESPERLRSGDMVPSSIGDNIKTDIVEEDEISRYGSCANNGVLGAGSTPRGPCDGHDYDLGSNPFINSHGGISIGPTDAARSWSGTLGFIAKDKSDSRLVGVSNNHVIGDYVDTNYSSLGCYVENGELSDLFKVDQDMRPIVENVIQTPSIPDSISENFVHLGKVKRSVPTKWGSGVLPANTVDAGIIELNPEIQPMTDLAYLSTDALRVGSARIGARVSKSGRTTGVTGVSDEISNPTTIISTNYTVAISSGCGDGLKTKFTDCIKFNWNTSMGNNWEFFSYAGDSGSAIMMDDNGQNKLIGLLFAGTYFQNSNQMPNPPYGTGIACKIQNVFDKLNIEAWNGNVICVGDSPFASLNGRCYWNTRAQRNTALVSHTNRKLHDSLQECNNKE